VAVIILQRAESEMEVEPSGEVRRLHRLRRLEFPPESCIGRRLLGWETFGRFIVRGRWTLAHWGGCRIELAINRDFGYFSRRHATGLSDNSRNSKRRTRVDFTFFS